MAPRILIFSMAMGTDYSFELIFNETCAPQFNEHNIVFLASVAASELSSSDDTPYASGT